MIITRPGSEEPALRLSRVQSKIFWAGMPKALGGSGKRFVVVVAGRRTGKTYTMGSNLVARGRHPKDFGIKSENPVLWYVAPTYRQGKQILWDTLKSLAAPYLKGRPNESDLSLRFKSGALAAIRGADNPDSLRGPGLDYLALDEYADIKPETFTKVLRPALADREGSALIGGTPKGRNHFYEIYQDAASLEGWARFQFTTLQGGRVSKEEIEESRRVMDERTFNQEYLATFESFAGLAYYAFDRDVHVKPCSLTPQRDILWCLDFNVDPMCSVIAQMHPYGSGRHQRIVEVCDEISIPNSNVYEACEAFARKVGPFAERYGVTVTVYADASGDSRNHVGTTAVQAIKQWFNRHPNYRVYYKIPQANPAVADRVRTVNSVLRNIAGEVRMQIDPKCKKLIADFEQVEWANEMGLDINKSDPKLTHISDALGYMTAQEFHEGQGQGIRSTIIA